MPERKGTKTIQLSWAEWLEYCAEHNLDPREQSEDGYDLGGGNSITFECHDDPPITGSRITIKEKKGGR